MFLQNNLDVNETIPIFLRGSTLYDKKKANIFKDSLRNSKKMLESNKERNQTNTKRYYFKNSMNLQKLIGQEKFDPEQIKEYYRKKYLNEEKRKKFIKFIKGVIKKGGNAIKTFVNWIKRKKTIQKSPSKI